MFYVVKDAVSLFDAMTNGLGIGTAAGRLIAFTTHNVGTFGVLHVCEKDRSVRSGVFPAFPPTIIPSYDADELIKFVPDICKTLSNINTKDGNLYFRAIPEAVTDKHLLQLPLFLGNNKLVGIFTDIQNKSTVVPLVVYDAMISK